MSVARLRDVRLTLGAGGAKPGPAIGQVTGSFIFIIPNLIFHHQLNICISDISWDKNIQVTTL